ncbi:MGH1-like glycoside hydrolase domain-containing protein [Rhodopila sp.]|uniref:MGH1-like glycoside hydrolase domain-containing protein n=1 Tax=Rhodopila sp. TaxID=2480087 RepID=UPI002C9D2673|nr:glucosidase [Rhodopila sp.]HVZ07721.1 glucosidase [Rhodopila sp.]
MHGRLLNTAEGKRLSEDRAAWLHWGPYLAEREWGTVREDYSADGNAWDYLPFDASRSRAYRWGEDGIAGFTDDRLRWCLSVALWNGKDPILKERMFGLTNQQGNHGEDVKELYYFLDGTPSHSYMRMLYKYPQAEFPYQRLIEENARRGQDQREYELTDTGVFAENRYFDVTVEYAKASPEDVLIRITVANRGPEAADLQVLPTLWARNTWDWRPGIPIPALRVVGGAVAATHNRMSERRFYIDTHAPWLFCRNETNTQKLYGSDEPGPFKDGINDFVVNGRKEAIDRATGTKVSAQVKLTVPPGGQTVIRLRWRPAELKADPFADHDEIMAARIADADEFYAALQQNIEDEDARAVQRQALAGMLWSKMFYRFDVRRWLDGDPLQPPPPPGREHIRNRDWRHLNNREIISMPDTWEYPWYAAWDLAFHAVTFALIDPTFAKQQLMLLTHEWYMHPNGSLPAYEWDFNQANPPVHAWAAWRVFRMDAALTGKPDFAFLEEIFLKLLINFTGWVNRNDVEGRNVFQGGFLGLDNIEVFDRSQHLPVAGIIDQSDGTSWMAMYALNMMRIALELATRDPVYQSTATKFFEHFLAIAEVMTRQSGQLGLWDEKEQFYFNVLRRPDGSSIPLRLFSIVGLFPLLAVEVLEPDTIARNPVFASRLNWVLEHRPDLAALVSNWDIEGQGARRLLSLLRGHRIKRLLRRMLDEAAFFSPYGVRSVSKLHKDKPFTLDLDGQHFSVNYVPGESDTRAFGGNSNWRGPIWMPVNFMLAEALYGFYRYYGDDFQVEYPVDSGETRSLKEIADELTARLTHLFLRGKDGRRPAMGPSDFVHDDPHFRDRLLFHEYFHGETGEGLGASHQTGWTGLIALLLHHRNNEDPTRMDVSLEPGQPSDSV